MSEREKAVARVVEVLSAIVIVVSITVIAIPKYADIKRRDTANELLGDLETFKTAVYAFYSDSAYFPEESPDGSVPENLGRYLPRGFSLTRSYGSIQYRNWPVRGKQDSVPAPNIVGATVTTTDPRIAATAASRSLNTARFTVGNKYTFLFFGS